MFCYSSNWTSSHVSDSADFQKIARDTNFQFNMQRGGVNWNQIEKLNLERLIEEQNVGMLGQHLSNVVNFNIDEFNVRVLNSSFVKILKLSQLEVDFLLHCKRHLSQQIGLLKSELDKLNRKMIMVRTENVELKKIIQWNKWRPSGSNEMAVCNICGKFFQFEYYLIMHIQRRHPDVHPYQMVGDQSNIINREPGEYVDETLHNKSTRNSRPVDHSYKFTQELESLRNLIVTKLGESGVGRSNKEKTEEDQKMIGRINEEEIDVEKKMTPSVEKKMEKTDGKINKEDQKVSVNELENTWRKQFDDLDSKYQNEIYKLQNQLKIVIEENKNMCNNILQEKNEENRLEDQVKKEKMQTDKYVENDQKQKNKTNDLYQISQNENFGGHKIEITKENVFNKSNAGTEDDRSKTNEENRAIKINYKIDNSSKAHEEIKEQHKSPSKQSKAYQLNSENGVSKGNEDLKNELEKRNIWLKELKNKGKQNTNTKRITKQNSILEYDKFKPLKLSSVDEILTDHEFKDDIVENSGDKNEMIIPKETNKITEIPDPKAMKVKRRDYFRDLDESGQIRTTEIITSPKNKNSTINKRYDNFMEYLNNKYEETKNQINEERSSLELTKSIRNTDKNEHLARDFWNEKNQISLTTYQTDDRILDFKLNTRKNFLKKNSSFLMNKKDNSEDTALKLVTHSNDSKDFKRHFSENDLQNKNESQQNELESEIYNKKDTTKEKPVAHINENKFSHRKKATLRPIESGDHSINIDNLSEVNNTLNKYSTDFNDLDSKYYKVVNEIKERRLSLTFDDGDAKHFDINCFNKITPKNSTLDEENRDKNEFDIYDKILGNISENNKVKDKIGLEAKATEIENANKVLSVIEEENESSTSSSSISIFGLDVKHTEVESLKHPSKKSGVHQQGKPENLSSNNKIKGNKNIHFNGIQTAITVHDERGKQIDDQNKNTNQTSETVNGNIVVSANSKENESIAKKMNQKEIVNKEYNERELNVKLKHDVKDKIQKINKNEIDNSEKIISNFETDDQIDCRKHEFIEHIQKDVIQEDFDHRNEYVDTIIGHVISNDKCIKSDEEIYDAKEPFNKTDEHETKYNTVKEYSREKEIIDSLQEEINSENTTEGSNYEIINDKLNEIDMQYSIKEDILNRFENELKKINLNPEWSKIPDKTYEQKMNYMKQRMNWKRKTFKNYETIKSQIKRKLENLVKEKTSNTIKIKKDREKYDKISKPEIDQIKDEMKIEIKNKIKEDMPKSIDSKEQNNTRSISLQKTKSAKNSLNSLKDNFDKIEEVPMFVDISDKYEANDLSKMDALKYTERRINLSSIALTKDDNIKTPEIETKKTAFAMEEQVKTKIDNHDELNDKSRTLSININQVESQSDKDTFEINETKSKSKPKDFNKSFESRLTKHIYNNEIGCQDDKSRQDTNQLKNTKNYHKTEIDESKRETGSPKQYTSNDDIITREADFIQTNTFSSKQSISKSRSKAYNFLKKYNNKNDAYQTTNPLNATNNNKSISENLGRSDDFKNKGDAFMKLRDDIDNVSKKFNESSDIKEKTGDVLGKSFINTPPKTVFDSNDLFSESVKRKTDNDMAIIKAPYNIFTLNLESNNQTDDFKKHDDNFVSKSVLAEPSSTLKEDIGMIRSRIKDIPNEFESDSSFELDDFLEKNKFG